MVTADSREMGGEGSSGSGSGSRSRSGSGSGDHVDFAVVVGIEHYTHASPLRGAVADAMLFKDWLCNPQGGGLQPENVQLILSDGKTAVPTQDDIDDKLLLVLNAAHRRGGARRLYFYFAGHGASSVRTGDDVALLLTHWRKSRARLALSTTHYSSAVCGARTFEEIAIFIDCCRNPHELVIGVEPTITPEWKALFASTRTFIACASEAGQPAYEVPESERWNGIFTRQLLRILGQYPNGISAQALKYRLELEIAKVAKDRGIEQAASAKDGFLSRSLFGKGGTWPPLKIKFAKRCGEAKLLDGSCQEVRRKTVVDGELWSIELPIGLYLIDGVGEPGVIINHDGRDEPHVV